MIAPTTSHAPHLMPRAHWLEFQQRPGLGVCPCAVFLVGRWYSRATCPLCHGAGVGAYPAPHAEVR